MGRKLLWLSKVRLRMVDLHRSVMTAMGLLGVCQPGSRQTAKFSPRSGRAGRRNSSERRAERAEKNDWVGWSAQPVMRTGETLARLSRRRTRDGAGRARPRARQVSWSGQVPQWRRRTHPGPRIRPLHGNDGTLFCDPRKKYCAAAPGVERM